MLTISYLAYGTPIEAEKFPPATSPYMKRLYQTITCLLLILPPVTLMGQATSQSINIGHKDLVYSRILSENRSLFVYVPQADGKPQNKPKYPVVYLLDGGNNFTSFVGALQYLSQVNNLCPPMIVVGILNTDRMRDLTPTHYSSPRSDSVQFTTSGGGENFTQFLEKELIPYIDSHYPTSPDRMLIGHSLGGILVVNTFIHHTHLFKYYLSIDPSLTWNEGKLLQQYLAALPRKKFTNKTFFLTAANFAGLDSIRASHDHTRYTEPTRSIFNFAYALKAKKDAGLDWACKYYPSESHFTVPLPSEYDALKFIFRKKPAYLTLRQLQAMEGRYQFESIPGKKTFMQVTAGKDYLVVKQLWDGKEFTVLPESEFGFYCSNNPFTISFIKNEKGHIKQALVFNQDLWTKVEP